MTAAAPTVGQIKARLATIPEKSRRGKAIGIHCPGRWPGASTVEVEGHEFVIHQCNSPLEMRMVLREPIAASATKVLITSLRDGDVGDDVLLRLAKRRLFEIKPWEIVRSLFDAHVVDPRLTKRRWLAEVLLEILPDEGLPVARGGFLDAETVWALLLEQSMGLTSATPDLTAILKWSLDVKGTERFRNQREEFRNAVIEWLAEKAGPVAEVVLGCIGRLDRPDAVPVGLAAGTVYDPRAS